MCASVSALHQGASMAPMAGIWEVLLQDTHPAVCWPQAPLVKASPLSPHPCSVRKGEERMNSWQLQCFAELRGRNPSCKGTGAAHAEQLH